MDLKKRNELTNMTRDKAILFVKDFRVMQFNEFIKKHKLSSVFAHELNNLAFALIKKHSLTPEELAKDKQ